MAPDIAICLTILATALVLFAWDRLPAEVIAIGVMLAVVMTGLLPPEKAFQGFSSDTVMMILGLLIMSAGLLQTGVVDIAGSYVFGIAGRYEAVFLPVIMTAVATVSAFMSNTAATAFFEGVLLPRSLLIGRSLRTLEFKERYGLTVLALHRAGRVPHNISSARLRLGDVLLLQGKPESVKELERGNLFNIFGGVDPKRFYRARAPLAALIFTAAILAVTFGFASLPIAALAGAFAMFVARCLSPEEAYRHIEWKVLILIGALLSLGETMDATGTGKYLAQQLIALFGADNPSILLSVFFVLTVALTQPMSNQAAALVVLPIALQTGLELSVNPRTFAMMVAVAASCSYLTPLEPSCLMVYGPGKYRFLDFFKVGTPLTILIFVISMLLVPRLWPL